MQTRRRQRGFLLMDAMVGLTIMSAIAASLVTAVTLHRHQSVQLGHRRAAMNLAQSVLYDLQLGRPAEAQPDEEYQVRIEPDEQAPAPADRVWVSVEVTDDKAGARIVGLVPRKSLAEASP